MISCDMLVPETPGSFVGSGCRRGADARVESDRGEKLNVCGECLAALKSTPDVSVVVVGEPVRQSED